jgi:hypothetical protein
MVSSRRFRRFPCTNSHVARYKGGMALTDSARRIAPAGLTALRIGALHIILRLSLHPGQPMR